MAGHRTSTEVLQEVLQIPGVNAAIVVGRDGFIIETVGTLRNINLDLLGASVAMVLTGTERMGKELKLSAFNTLTMEYNDAMVMCHPISEALLVIVAPDSKTLGIIRLQVKKFIGELEHMF